MLRKIDGVEQTITLREEDGRPAETRTRFRIRMLSHRETVEQRVAMQDVVMAHSRDPVGARSTALAEYYANSFADVVLWVENYGAEDGKVGPRIDSPKGLYDFAWHYMTEDQITEVINRARAGSANLQDEVVLGNA